MMDRDQAAKLLRVAPHATEAQIEAAYRRRVKVLLAGRARAQASDDVLPSEADLEQLNVARDTLVRPQDTVELEEGEGVSGAQNASAPEDTSEAGAANQDWPPLLAGVIAKGLAGLFSFLRL